MALGTALDKGGWPAAEDPPRACQVDVALRARQGRSVPRVMPAGIDVNLPDPPLFSYQVTEPYQQPLERGHIDGLATAHTGERCEDLGALHDAPRQGRV